MLETMTLASTTLVPELQTWFYNFVINSEINKYEVPAPVPIDPIFLSQNSFIEMLFNESYSGTTYKYLYQEETRTQCWPTLTRQRLMIYPRSAKYLVLSDTGQNVFDLKADDFTLLNALLAYRQDSTGVVIVDSTATYFVDSTAVSTLYATYSNLKTELSKLIYLYLDLKINDNYANYDNLNLVSTTGLLETLYELVLIDEFFKYMTGQNVIPSQKCGTVT
jgi:hypothetical protein